MTKKIPDTIDWNFKEHGKLWTYNLNYFDFINAQEIGQEDGLELIQKYIQSYESIRDGKDPYPTSLRIMNWIKFLSAHSFNDQIIHEILIRDTSRLLNNLEYHLLANHLLENAFALLFSSYYFQDKGLYAHAHRLVTQELNEQILSDGAHYELSPMYHQLILYRILDCVHLIQQNAWIQDDLIELLLRKAKSMLSWLSQITFNCGDIPLVNDSAKNVNPSTSDLIRYAKQLNIDFELFPLKESGYRMIQKACYEVFCDVANIIPAYQPGHSHADTLNYILYVNNSPIIVDSGTATYEVNDRRYYERSSKAHNTIVLDEKNSSKVWSGFRVAQRASVTLRKEDSTCLIASHNGYTPIIHTRQWLFEESAIVIRDSLSTCIEAKAYIHFHPTLGIEKLSDNLIGANSIKIQFDNSRSLNMIEYGYAEEFNKVVPAKAVEILFIGNLTTTIILN